MRWVEHPPGTYLGRVVADAGAVLAYRDGVRELLGRPPLGPAVRTAGSLPPAVLRYLQPSLRPDPWAAGHAAHGLPSDRTTARDDPPPSTADHLAGTPGRAVGVRHVEAARGPTTAAPARRVPGPVEPSPKPPPRVVAGPEPSPAGGAGGDLHLPAGGRWSDRPASDTPSPDPPSPDPWGAAAPSPSRPRARPQRQTLDVPPAPRGSGAVPDAGPPPSAPEHLPVGGPAPARTRPTAKAGSDLRAGPGTPSSVPEQPTAGPSPAPTPPPTSAPHRDAVRADRPARAQLRRSADGTGVEEDDVVAGRTRVAPRSASRQLRPPLTEASLSASGAAAAGQLRSRPGSAVDTVRSALRRAAAPPPTPPSPPRSAQSRTPPTPRTAAAAPDGPRRRERVVRAPGGPVVSAYWSRLNVGRVGLRGPR